MSDKVRIRGQIDVQIGSNIIYTITVCIPGLQNLWLRSVPPVKECKMYFNWRRQNMSYSNPRQHCTYAQQFEQYLPPISVDPATPTAPSIAAAKTNNNSSSILFAIYYLSSYAAVRFLSAGKSVDEVRRNHLNINYFIIICS